jgi:transposase
MGSGCGSLGWTQENRARHGRGELRYPSGLTDEEWAIVGPLIPPAKRGGNKRTVEERAAVDGVMDILSTGCRWAAPPEGLPPRSTVDDHRRRWDGDRTLARIHHALHVPCRERAGRGAGPTAATIDSRSVEGAEEGGAASTGRATTPARGSRARSATSWSTPRAR